MADYKKRIFKDSNTGSFYSVPENLIDLIENQQKDLNKTEPLVIEPIKEEIKDIELVDRKPKNPIEFEPIESK